VTNPAGQESHEHDAPDLGARADWERRIYRRLTDTSTADASLALPAPGRVRAAPGAGHVRLDWDPVDGAAGYLIERDGPGGTQLLQHGGSDVPAVPSSPFADTGVENGSDYRYRIAAVPGAEYPAWNWSPWATATVRDEAAAPIELGVDAATSVGTLQRVWHMVGSERLTQLRFGDDGNGNDIGTEFAESLRIAKDDLGVSRVRAHAILHDDNHVVTRATDGMLAFDFTAVDALYDQVLAIGVRPVVELSFMPAVIARDPEQTVFAYRGIISPPADWDEWRQVVHALAAHLVERYGIDEVIGWAFEVWNEPNLEVFWTGTQADYLRLYDEAAAAVKQVDGRLLVGGPSTAAAEWIEALAAHAQQDGVPLDFVTSHTYGNIPLDDRPSLHRHGFDGIPTWWTEWGVGSTHYGPIHDGVIGAPFALTGFHGVQGRMQALAYWVISDHFEELGRPPSLFHNGFGLLTVGNLRKPRYWAVHLAAHQGDDVLASTVKGDGADVLVRSWATKHDNGTVDVLIWNGTINGALMDGDDRLDRDIRLAVTGLGGNGYTALLARVDEHHSNILEDYPKDTPWPDARLWESLHARDFLYEEALPAVAAGDGTAHFEIALPMPGVARLRLQPGPNAAAAAEKEGSP
jgi:xylan 1,4-beta-xylosidase